MAKIIAFDAGPIINLAINNLLPTLEGLKKQYGGEFIIPYKVKEELINRPLAGLKFKFEALRTLSFIEEGIIKTIADQEIEEEASEFLQIVNQCFRKNGRNLEIMHKGEAEAIITGKMMDAEAIVIDETTARIIIEDPESYRQKLEHKLRSKITINQEKLRQLKKITSGMKVIRSSELMVIAYNLGLLDQYLPERIPNSHETLLNSVLWALKLNGCSITQKEINRIVKRELKA